MSATEAKDNLVEIVDNAGYIRNALEAIFYLYERIESNDQEIPRNAVFVATRVLGEKVRGLLKEIEDKANEVMRAN